MDDDFYMLQAFPLSYQLVCRFQKNLAVYQTLVTRCAYDKQLDSGRGTLLHLCDNVIQQEVRKPKDCSSLIYEFYIYSDSNVQQGTRVITSILFMIFTHRSYLHLLPERMYSASQVKEVIISFFILMQKGKASRQVTYFPWNAHE